MSHSEALDLLAGDGHIGRYRWLCRDENPDMEQRDAYRGLVIGMANGRAPEPDKNPRVYVNLVTVTGSSVCCGGPPPGVY